MFKNKKNIFLVLVTIIILMGITMFCIKGLNYNLSYGKNTSIIVSFSKEVDINELEQITEEVIENKAKVRTINDSNSYILITVKEISDEQKTNLITRINEKYELELKEEDLEITNNAQIKLFDMIKPYIIPALISIALILLYFIIRYKKYGIVKIILETLGSILILEATLFSIYAIARIPINSITMPISVILFVIVIIGLMEKLKKEETKIKEKEKKNSNKK